MTPLGALARTVLLVRDFVSEPEASDDAVVAALTSVTVAIVADDQTIRLPSAQGAISSLAAQVLASGAQLKLAFPNTRVVGEQPPLRGQDLHAALIEFAADLIPGGGANVTADPSSADVVFVVGNSPHTMVASNCWRLGWTKWAGVLATAAEAVSVVDADLPLGPLVSATLGAAEVFKFAVRKLLNAMGVERIYDELAATTRAEVRLAPEDTEVTCLDFGRVDVISGGAIANAFLHGLLRIPRARAAVRVFEPEKLDLSNTNRYALARRSAVGELKTSVLEDWQTDGLRIVGESIRFDENTPVPMQLLAPIVLVGTDDIPSRWFVQSLQPSWLCVGATAHFTAMVSEHRADSACAGCLHPEDDDVHEPIATAAFVSYWAGLLLLVRLLRSLSNRPIRDTERVLEIAALQAGETRGMWAHPVIRTARCPLRCARAA